MDEYYELISKNKDIIFQGMLHYHFFDLEYLECLLKDEKEVFHLYVRSLNDDYHSTVNSSDEKKLRENVNDLFNVCCLDVDLHDSFYDEDRYKMYQKVVKIFEDFQNSDEYKYMKENDFCCSKMFQSKMKNIMNYYNDILKTVINQKIHE